MVHVYGSKEKVVFYLSRRMLDTETRYHEMDKLCLCLFITCTKLRHILLFAVIIVICKSDIIKYMLSAPVLKGRLGKWIFTLSEFDIWYQPAKAVKGQALVDQITERINTNIATLSVRACAM
jgi:ribonuclease HI